MPRVSVILTSYNHAKYIKKSIESVLEQTFDDFELLILDDYSKDDSVQVITSFQDSRISLFQSEKPQLVINGLNRLIHDVAHGEYIAIHHSDDMWTPEKLKKQVAYLDSNPNIGAVFTHVQAIDDKGKPIHDQGNIYNRVFQTANRTREEWLRYFFCEGNCLCHPSILIRKQCYLDCGAYSHGAVSLGDFNMWVRLCLRYPIHILEEKLTLFRHHSNGSNTSGDNSQFHTLSAVTYFNTMKHYREIATFSELCAIFPEACEYDRGKETNLLFALAMLSVNFNPNRASKLFALEILYELLEDAHTRQNLANVYNFDRNTYSALICEADPFSRNEVVNLHKELKKAIDYINTLELKLRYKTSP